MRVTTTIMDSTLAAVVEKYQDSKLKNSRDDPDSDSDSLLELLDSLENEDEVVSRYREQRLDELKSEMRKIDAAAATFGESLGTVQYYSDERELMTVVAGTPAAVVHFFQPTFSKCKLMNEKLALVAEKHVSLAILAIPAEKAPFLVAKLKIKVLPFVVVYRGGKEVSRIIGFEGLGSGTDIQLSTLENKFLLCGAISRRTINGSNSRLTTTANEDSDDDWY